MWFSYNVDHRSSVKTNESGKMLAGQKHTMFIAKELPILKPHENHIQTNYPAVAEIA